MKSLYTLRRDWVPVLAVALLALWEIPRRVAEGGEAAWLAAFTVLCIVPIAWRRTAPLMCLLVVATAFAVYPLANGSPEVLTHAVALLFMLYAAAVLTDGTASWVVLGVGVAVGLARALTIGEYDTVDAIVNAAWALPPWLVGRLVRQRDRRAAAAETLAEETLARSARAEGQAVQRERERIARELHDVVAHAVTVMVVQARGGRHCVVRDPEAAVAAFAAVEEQGRQALAELRRLLSVLPTGTASEPDIVPDPLPGLDAAEGLVERMRRAGLEVHLTSEGAGPALPASADFSAYRVLQEALTNAMRYGAGRTDVHLSWHATGVDLEVRNPVGDQSGLGSSAGLVGARERVAAFGGTFRAECEGDVFVLRASLPCEAADPGMVPA